MKEAKKMAEKGRVADYVHTWPTTEEEHKALKPKPPKLTWKEGGKDTKDTWLAVVPDERVPARIRMLDKKTWACYRNGSYLGGEETRALAEMRVAIGKVNQHNAVMRLWEKVHPNELPPFLQLTDEERRVYWERNPPTRPPPRPARVGTPKEDAATKRLREAVAQDGSAGRAGRAKVAKAASDGRGAIPDGVIRVANATNPKKVGTGAHARWALLFSHDGKTVKQFAEAKGNLTTLENAVKKGNVKVEEGK